MSSMEIAEFIVDASLFAIAFLCGTFLLVTGLIGYFKRRG